MSAFHVQLPQGPRVPLLLSIPHCGTMIPQDLRDQYKPDFIHKPDDTDWFVDQLYDFAPSLGITTISAVYSRWVIDLNRDPENKPLYSDGRIITSLCPSTNFLGEALYLDERPSVHEAETQRRLQLYYWPYHEKLDALLDDLKSEFGKVLLWECHSIRQRVPTISSEKLPDLILGDVDGESASPAIIETAYNCLKESSYSLSHNFPFKGGYITRKYGLPLKNQQAIQLEMTKINYMDDTETSFHPNKAEQMKALLKTTLGLLIDSLSSKA